MTPSEYADNLERFGREVLTMRQELAAATARAEAAEALAAEQEMVSSVSLDQRDECLRELAAAKAASRPPAEASGERMERAAQDIYEASLAETPDEVRAACRPWYQLPSEVRDRYRRIADAAFPVASQPPAEADVDGLAEAAWRAFSADIPDLGPWSDLILGTKDRFRRIARVLDSIPQPRPAAIVEMPEAFHAFENRAEARSYYQSHRDAIDCYMIDDYQWHPAGRPDPPTPE